MAANLCYLLQPYSKNQGLGTLVGKNVSFAKFRENMKLIRFTLIQILCLFAFSSFSQNWLPFVTGQHAWYEYDNQHYACHYLIDSVNNQNDGTWYFFNTKIGLNPGCYNSASSILESSGYGGYGPPFRIKSMFQKNDSIFLFTLYDINIDTILLKPWVEPGETWIWNSRTFICTSVEFSEFMGIEDSVKTFQCISGTLSGLEIKLSKKFGLVQFPDFQSLANQSSNPADVTTFNIFGIRKGELKIGYNQPGFSDYFHLNAGDVLFKVESYDPENPMYEGYYHLFKDSIIYAFHSPDSVFYQFKRQFYNNGFQTTTYTEKYIRKYLEKIFQSSTNQFGIGEFQNETWPQVFNSILRIHLESDDTLTFFGFILPGVVIDTFTCEIGYIVDLIVDYNYSTLTGLQSQSIYTWGSNYLYITGSIINGIPRGNTWFPNSVEEYEYQAIKVYPNPVENTIFIEAPSNYSISHFALKDLQGKILINDSFKNTINCNYLSPGFYFLELCAEDSKIYRFKILKN